MINYKEFSKLDEGEQALISWQYMHTGCFSDQLMDLIVKADSTNLLRLEQGFPKHVTAWKKFAHEHAWWPKIQKRVFQPTLEVINGAGGGGSGD